MEKEEYFENPEDTRAAELLEYEANFCDKDVSREAEELITTFFTNLEDDSFFETLNDTKTTQYVCPLCQVSFVGKKAMRDHVRRYFKYVCQTCGKRYFRERYLMMHLKNAHLPSKMLECPICTKVFKAVNNLKQHLLLHSDVRSFVCTFEGCNKAFKQKPGLQQHIRFMHNPNMNFCKVCRKRVTGDMEKHNATAHTKKRNYNRKSTILQDSNERVAFDTGSEFYTDPESEQESECSSKKRKDPLEVKAGPAKRLKMEMTSDEEDESDLEDGLSATWKFDSEDEDVKTSNEKYVKVIKGLP